MWTLLYDAMNTTIQKYWKYARQYAVQNSLTNSEYYSWDKFAEAPDTVDLSDVTWSPPKEFDSRFYYYSQETNLTEQLSTEECRETTEEKEVAKTGLYKGLFSPPWFRYSEGQKSQEMKGKSSTKEEFKEWGKQSSGKGMGKLPSTFVPVSSTAEDEDTPINERKEKLMHRTFHEWTWGILRKFLIQQGVTIHNLRVFEFTYLHWFQQLEHVLMNVPIEDVLNPLYEVELQSLISDFPEDATPETREVHTGILIESLTHIKFFMSSFGVGTADFFDQDTTMRVPFGGKSGEKGKGKSKDLPEGKPLKTRRQKEENRKAGRALQTSQRSHHLLVNQMDRRL